jgi:hypothetical protein
MAWTAPTTRATGFLVTAAVYNGDIINNLLYLHGDAGVAIDLSTGAQNLIVGGKLIEGGATEQTGLTVPTSWTPNLSVGLWHRATVTAGGANTLTINSPSNPMPAGNLSALLHIKVNNSGGGGVTLSWSAAANGFEAAQVTALPTSVANGAQMTATFVWDPFNGKWQIIAAN